MIDQDTAESVIRNYKECDADLIGEFAPLLELAYRYNRDFEPANTFCLVSGCGEIGGVAHLEPDESWALIEQKHGAPDIIHKLRLGLTMNPHVVQTETGRERLLQCALARAQELRRPYPEKRVQVVAFLATDEQTALDYYLSHGFTLCNTILVMKRDLEEEIPAFDPPEGITLVNSLLETEAEQRQYQAAEARSCNNNAWSLNRLQWCRNDPSWGVCTARVDEQLIGSVMTWQISETRSATENIFVVPEWRKRGIARYLITETLRTLKAQGTTVATLCVYADNTNAIALYMSLGYRMFFVQLQLGYTV